MKIMFAVWWAVLGGAGILTANIWLAYNFGILLGFIVFGPAMWLYASGFKFIGERL